MSAVVQQAPQLLPAQSNVAAAKDAGSIKAATESITENIPDVIEENRKDASGQVTTYKYQRGRLLGKVNMQI